MNRGTFAGMSSPGLVLAAGMDLSIEQMLTTSQTWVTPKTGEYLIFAVGAGGGGSGVNASITRGGATGGGAGGLAIKRAYLTRGTVLAITIGAGGSRATFGGFNDNTYTGTDGGATTVSGGGISLWAGGGQAGQCRSSSSLNVILAGRTGGAASGGDLNFTGGGSGSTSVITASAFACTGGGAVAWYGVGYSSGNASIDNINANGALSATGGAGIGGNSGNASVTANTSYVCYTGGGGTAGPSPNQTASAASVTQGAGGPGIQNQTNATIVVPSIFRLYGGGGTPPFNATSGIQNQGPGGGTPANGATATSPPFSGYQSMLAGQGAGGPAALNGLAAGLGGGGGGARAGDSSGGNGGNGVVFIVWGWQ